MCRKPDRDKGQRRPTRNSNLASGCVGLFPYQKARTQQTENMETFNDVINSGQLVLVDFYATWCQPCKMMHPILQQVKEVLGDSIRIIKVDVDKYSVTADQYGIQSVPTLMLFRQGEMLWRTSGVVHKADLLATIDPFIR